MILHSTITAGSTITINTSTGSNAVLTSLLDLD